MSFNIMTLGGMAAAVGLIIDDTIVMVEHIIRRLRGSTGDHHRQVMRAAREFSSPLMGSSASTIIIFLPLAFLSGVTGAFFKSLSLTMAASPFHLLLCRLAGRTALGRSHTERQGCRERGRWCSHTICATGIRSAHAPPAGAPLAGSFSLSYRCWLSVGWATPRVGSGFMPSMDEGGFILDYRTAPGTSLAETNRLLHQVGAILRVDAGRCDVFPAHRPMPSAAHSAKPTKGIFSSDLKPLPQTSYLDGHGRGAGENRTYGSRDRD